MDDGLQMPRVFLAACWQVPRLLNAPWKQEFDKPSCYLKLGVGAKALTRSVLGCWANSPLLMKKDSCWQMKGSWKCSHSSHRENAPQGTLSKEQHSLSDLVPQPELPYALESEVPACS